MTIQITDVKLGGGSGHQAITQYYWVSSDSKEWTDKASMVDWVRENPNQAWVGGPPSAWVVAVPNPQGQDFLRTVADGAYTDNLLSLPGAR